MIDLSTATRTEFIEHTKNLEGFIKHLESEVHHLNLRLQEYEGIETEESQEDEFQKFWELYGKKGNLKTSRAKFKKLSKKKKTLIFEKLPEYIKSTPVKSFRKNAEKWLQKECWNDEIITQASPTSSYAAKPAVRAIFFEGNKADESKAEELRKANAGLSVKDRLKLNKGE